MIPQGLSDGLQRVLLIPRLREKGDNYLKMMPNLMMMSEINIHKLQPPKLQLPHQESPEDVAAVF